MVNLGYQVNFLFYDGCVFNIAFHILEHSRRTVGIARDQIYSYYYYLESICQNCSYHPLVLIFFTVLNCKKMSLGHYILPLITKYKLHELSSETFTFLLPKNMFKFL